MKIHNYTPHEVVLYHPTSTVNDGTGLRLKPGAVPVRTFPSMGTIRAENQSQLHSHIFEENYPPVTVYRNQYGTPIGVPEDTEGCALIVSAIAAKAMAETHPNVMCLMPNGLVRDDEGRIIGCTSFAII